METLRLPARSDSLPSLCSFVLGKAEQANVSQEMAFRIEVVLEELLTNVIKYAYPVGGGDVEIGCCVDSNRRLWLSIRDWGCPFDPLLHQDPDVSLDLSERPVGGLGIYVVRRYAHELSYERHENGNVLTLCLQL